MSMRIYAFTFVAGTVCVACGSPPAARSSDDVRTTSGLTPQQMAAGTVETFEGKWSFDGRVTPPGESQSMPVKMELECQRTAGGKAVRCSYVTHAAGQPDGDGGFLIGYDNYGGKVHFMAMTSDEEVHDHVCVWKDMHDLDCGVLEGGLGGQKVAEELRFHCESPGVLSLYSNSRLADGKRLVLEASGKRTAPATAQR